MKGIRIYRYCLDTEAFYNEMKREGQLLKTYYDNGMSYKEFLVNLSYLDSNRFVYKEDKILGHVFATGSDVDSCFVHFCVLRRGLRYVLETTEELLLSFGVKNLFVKIPAYKSDVIKIMARFSFKYLCDLPDFSSGGIDYKLFRRKQ